MECDARGGAPHARCSRYGRFGVVEEAAETGKILGMLVQQDAKERLRWHEPPEAAVHIDDREATLVGLDGTPSRDLLIHVRCDDGRVVVHDLAQAHRGRCAEQPLDRHETPQLVSLADRDGRGALVLLTSHRCEGSARGHLGWERWDPGRRVVARNFGSILRGCMRHVT